MPNKLSVLLLFQYFFSKLLFFEIVSEKVFYLIIIKTHLKFNLIPSFCCHNCSSF